MSTTRTRTRPPLDVENNFLKQEIKQLREDLYESRRAIIDILPDEISELLREYSQCHCYKDLVSWRRSVIKQLSQLQNCAVEGFFPRRGRKKGGKSGYRQLKAGKMKGLATIHSDTQDEYYL